MPRSNVSLYFYFALLLAGIAALHFSYGDFIPCWDAGHSFHSAMAVIHDGKWPELNIRGHISVAFLGLIAATQYFNYGSMHSFHFMMMVLHMLGTTAFYGILCELFPRRELRARHALAAAVCAFGPILAAQAVNADMDFAIAMFSTIFVYMVLRRRLPGILLSGILMAFSKESGVIAVVLVCVFCIGFWAFKGRQGIARTAIFAAALLALSTFYALYVLGNFQLEPSQQNVGAIWSHALGPGTKISYWFNWGFLREITPFNPRLRYILFDLFVLHFAWLPSLLLLAALGMRAAYLLSRRSRSREFSPAWGFWLCLFLGGAMLFVDISTVVGFELQHTPRYRLIVWPWLVVGWYSALLYVFRGKTLHYGVLLVFLIVLLASNIRTLDPVSIRLAGTFDYGSHRLLHMTNWTREREFPDPGQDRLAHNLQPLVLHELLDQILADLGPSKRRPLFYHHPRAWLDPLWIDPVTFKRSANPLFYDGPLHESAARVLSAAHPLRRFFYLSLPFLRAADEELLEKLRRRYTLTGEKTYDYRGYAAKLYTFESEDPSAGDLPAEFTRGDDSRRFPNPVFLP